MVPEDYQALFFDFDGVLVDSVEVKTTAFARMFEPYGADIVAQVVDYHRRHGGMTRVDKFRYYYAELLKQPLSEARLAQLCDDFAKLVVDEVVAAPEITGAEEFLQVCLGRVSCLVISAAPAGELDEIINRRGLAGFFHEVHGAPGKKAEHLASILHRTGWAPSKCLFFGDAASDYNAARACDVPFLGVVPGEDAPLLEAANGICWVRDFSQLQVRS